MPANDLAPAGRLYDNATLVRWREESGLSRVDVCSALGLSYPWLAAVEQGATWSPSLERLTRLARFYGHEPGEALTGGAP